MRRVLAIAQANFIRTLRDRLGLFFIIVLPMILIVVLGITYGGQGTIRVGIVNLDGSSLSTDLVDSIAATDDLQVELRTFATAAELRDAVAHGHVNFGVLVEAGYDAALRSGAAGTVELMSPPTQASTAVGAVVERAVASQDSLVRAARFAAGQTGATFEEALEMARSRQVDAPGVAVAVESLADSSAGNPSGFTIGAQSQVLLFMFLTSLTGATELIVTRQLGISRRMFSTPTSMAAIILGEGAGRLALALFQGAFIVLASAFLFNVDWADPAATAAIVVVFAFVSAGAALLIGTLVKNASQAGAIAPAIGLIVALLGGTMVPPEVFPETMRTIGHATPHAWAMDAFRGLVFRGEGLVEILPELMVLAAFGFVFAALAGLNFRRLLASGSI
jgi:ABC-2 type transport system permease protein